MSDRIFSYTVILDGQYKDEDAQAIQEAIEMIKGVSKVVPKVADMELAFAVDQAKRNLGRDIIELICDKRKGE
jgi:hypothetical protein